MLNKKTRKSIFGAAGRLVLAAFFMCSVTATGFVVPVKQAYAHFATCSIPYPSICGRDNCSDARTLVREHHEAAENLMEDHITSAFSLYRAWLVETFFTDNLLKAMMMMTNQLSAVGMQQMMAVGALMDAKIQLETQLAFQELQVEAIKDYQPSQDFCTFGTNVRSLSASESLGIHNKMALNQIGMSRSTGQGNTATTIDARARWERFIESNCQVFNNNWDPEYPDTTGLQPACESSGDSARANADVQYERFVNSARTIDVDFTGNAASDSQQDLISLSRNIYGHMPLDTSISSIERRNAQELYFDLRRVAAKRNVAQNSFNTIVGLKSPGTAVGSASGNDTYQYMAAIMRNLGISDFAEITELMGENPSYLAQLEVMSKRIYQDQSFYANLYDKPENVQRTAVALRAIELMVEREMFESRLRKEMLVSTLLSSKLQKEYDRVEGNIERLLGANR